MTAASSRKDDGPGTCCWPCTPAGATSSTWPAARPTGSPAPASSSGCSTTRPPTWTIDGAEVVPADAEAARGAEIVMVFGGDGTFLRAAELARYSNAALMGVNLGRVGFLAETEPEAVEETLAAIERCEYSVEKRLAIEVDVLDAAGSVVGSTWALNEVSVEKAERSRVLDVVLGIDGRPLTSFGCDGVLFATPTGSTAYAFSAGGPVVWPDVEALLLVPTNAHALFARPLVTTPTPC